MDVRRTVLAVLAALIVTACGGDDETGPPPLPAGATPMPDVEGLRLDIAKSDLAKVGLVEGRVEVVGGGSLGILNESNWVVCDQQPAARRERSTWGRRLPNVRYRPNRPTPQPTAAQRPQSFAEPS